MNPTSFIRAAALAAISSLPAPMAGHAATSQNVDQTFSADPPVADVYFYDNPAGNTWTVNGNITVGDGTTTLTIDSCLVIGLRVRGTDAGDGDPDNDFSSNLEEQPRGAEASMQSNFRIRLYINRIFGHSRPSLLHSAKT